VSTENAVAVGPESVVRAQRTKKNKSNGGSNIYTQMAKRECAQWKSGIGMNDKGPNFYT